MRRSEMEKISERITEEAGQFLMLILDFITWTPFYLITVYCDKVPAILSALLIWSGICRTRSLTSLNYFNWYNFNFSSIKSVDGSLILRSVFFFLTDRTKEDLKEIKNRIEHISENLKTLKESPTGEEGQFPRTVAPCLRPVLLIDQCLFVCIVLGSHKNNFASKKEVQ